MDREESLAYISMASRLVTLPMIRHSVGTDFTKMNAEVWDSWENRVVNIAKHLHLAHARFTKEMQEVVRDD